jgi:hypothetical protein
VQGYATNFEVDKVGLAVRLAGLTAAFRQKNNTL